MVSWLPGILRKEQKKRVLGVRAGVTFALKRESLTAKQVAQRLGISHHQALNEIRVLLSEGTISIITTRTIEYDLTGPGRRTHRVKVYRAF